MSGARGQQNNNGVLSWVLLSAFCMGIILGLLWLVGSHYIVFYLTPVVDFLATPWQWLPKSMVGTALNDLAADRYINLRYPNRIGIGDWAQYTNKALKPIAAAFCALMILLFLRQAKKRSSANLNKPLDPTALTEEMMSVFTEIAPVVSIQSELVANKIKGWERQVFPNEFIEKARYQGQSVLVPNEDGSGLEMDRTRMRGYCEQRKKVKETKLLRSPFLGRQIVDILKDSQNKSIAFPDRLSHEGKAIFAILAPYAFGGKKGKAQSKKVSDALNLSAYGTPDGKANLSVREAQESFNEWRDHRLARQLGKIHHWENTYLWALLEFARRSGKIGTWSFIWLRPMNRVMFACLNTTGRKVPHSEAGVAFSHFQFERLCARSGYLPIHPKGKGEPTIFSRRVLDSLEQEWEFWSGATEGDDDWWKDDNLLENAHLLNDLRSLSSVIDLPPDED